MAAPKPEKAVSNSFDYVPVRSMPGFVLSRHACSARDQGLSSIGSSRILLVDALAGAEDSPTGDGEPGRRTVLCRTETGDFSESDIRMIVHERGQLYLDVSGKPSIDDFAVDVRQMVIAGECRHCPDFEKCCCFYVPAPRRYFDDDERWLAEFMRTLSGRVLDAGLGNVPYLRFLPSGGGAAGGLEYHGVDPDPEVGAAGGAGVILHETGIEDFVGFDGYFDNVLSLRSLNHFLDVPAAMDSIRRCMKPGGRALFIESLALPLVRSRRKAEMSHQVAAGGFQHLRNWDSFQLLDLVDAMNSDRRFFEVEYHRPVGPETCDQWIVLLRRTV